MRYLFRWCPRGTVALAAAAGRATSAGLVVVSTAGSDRDADDRALPAAELQVHLLIAYRGRAELAGYKPPRWVVVLPELPRNACGKVLKREIVCGLVV